MAPEPTTKPAANTSPTTEATTRPNTLNTARSPCSRRAVHLFAHITVRPGSLDTSSQASS